MPLSLTQGTIGSRVAGGAEAISALVAQAAGQPTQPVAQGEPCPNCGNVHTAGNGHAAGQAVPATRKIGTPAPPINFADLEGKSVKLRDFRGKKTLVLFWNPGCGFCQRMLDDLKAWEADPPEGAPKALVVSAGTVETNKEMGLSSPVVLDQQFSVGRAFGASGTPSAVLVDERGKIASEVAVGAPAVLELAGTRQAQA